MTEEATGQLDTNTSADLSGETAPAETVSDEVVVDEATTEEAEPAESGESEAAEGEGEQESGVPEEYSFDLPEGMEIDKALADAAAPVFAELGLTQEQASKLTEMYAGVMHQQAESYGAALEQQLTDWKQELITDQSFGGDNFEKNSAAVYEFVQKTVPNDIKVDLTDMLTQTGIGSHPSLVKYIHHLSKLMPVGEDNPGGRSTTPQKTMSVEERMYPSMVNN